MSKHIEPSISETAFSCPHCGAYTTQHWYHLHPKLVDKKNPTPTIPNQETVQKILNNSDYSAADKKEMVNWIKQMSTGLPFFQKGETYTNQSVDNMHLSKCYNCDKIAVWVYGSLIFPSHKNGMLPNPDLPDEITRDFEEARSIVDDSPRGASALLRLCVQKLCKHLGEKGRNIDKDIASLVAKGLNPVVQQSLDIVRVIGNESVHPGSIDLNDDRETALRLFELVNAITEQMISHPAKVKEMYAKLPEAKRQAIEVRDTPTD